MLGPVSYTHLEALAVGGRVCGPLTKSDGNVTALYNQYYAKFAHEYDNVTGDREMNVVLYFPDRSGKMCIRDSCCVVLCSFVCNNVSAYGFRAAHYARNDAVF